MTDAAADILNLTVADYDRIVESDRSERRYELIDGRLVMMTNPSLAHEQIVGNLGAPLKLAMNERGCRTYFGGASVQAPDDAKGRDKVRPDLAVHCGRADDRKNYITDPVFIAEVLSPSTMDYDRGKKLEFYKSLASVEHIALVYSDQTRIELYSRAGDDWAPEIVTSREAALHLAALQFEIPVAEIYFDTRIP